jgi:hypothetical protein
MYAWFANMTPVQNGLLSADAPGPRQMRTNRRRSTSLAPSYGSELSRVTLVENDPGLTADHNSKSDNSYEIITCDSPKYTWLNHLRGVFCLSLSKKDNMRKEYRRAKTPVRSVVCSSSSFAFFSHSDANIYDTISSFNSLTRTYRVIKTSQHGLRPGFSPSMSTQIEEIKVLRLFPRSENVLSTRAIYKATSCLVSSLKEYSNALQKCSAS